MQTIRSSLVADGTSDRALIPLIALLLKNLRPYAMFEETASTHSSLTSLAERINECLELYPCELLFVHRDAEAQAPQQRMEEINRACASVKSGLVEIVPVKMTEAWLLTDEIAIRNAVGNPNGIAPLHLPVLKAVEKVDAKHVLDAALTLAKDLDARRRGRFQPQRFRHRVAEQTNDLAKLRKLPSFIAFEGRLEQALANIDAARK